MEQQLATLTWKRQVAAWNCWAPCQKICLSGADGFELLLEAVEAAPEGVEPNAKSTTQLHRHNTADLDRCGPTETTQQERMPVQNTRVPPSWESVCSPCQTI